MAWLAFLLVLIAQGVVVGALGRLIVPGPDPMGIGKTALVGISGSLLAGIVARLLLNSYAGLVLSVLGAALIVLLLRRWDERNGRRTATNGGPAMGRRRSRWFVGPGIAGGVWTNAARRDREEEAVDMTERRAARHRHDPDEIVDAELVDEVPADAQPVESEIVVEDEGLDTRRAHRH